MTAPERLNVWPEAWDLLSVVRSIFRYFGLSLTLSMGDLIAYLSFATITWLAFFVVLRRFLAHRRISRKDPTREQMRRELWNSLRSILTFGMVGGVVVILAFAGWTKIYLNVDRFGWGWFFGSILVAVLLHDAYFYWTHRMMHHRWLYRWMHRVHHQSLSPTPWAAYSFSVPEAVVQAGIGPLIVMTIPIHPVAFSLFMTWQIGFNVFGHCGHEIFPNWFLRTRLGHFFNTPTHHGMHHEVFQANYGLYFNVWDRLMGTNHPTYQERFEEITRPAA